MTADFGLLRAIDVQSFGQPGQRTFRLCLVGSDAETASTWLEKEQLQALSLALKQMLSQLEYDADPPRGALADFPAAADHDFRVGRMGMGFNSADRTVILYLYEAGLDEDDEATLHARITQEQCASLGAALDDIIAGGRPVCPLCGVPMDAEGHMCVRTNGHSTQPIPDDEEGAPDDDELSDD
jgi:uncharacterized repeat protein (TIGR03847 family)